MKCNECSNANICLDHIEIPSLGGCTSGIPDRKVITNADRIRNMSDDELAELIPCPYMKDLYDECVHGWHDYDCSKCKLEWLQSEAE